MDIRNVGTPITASQRRSYRETPDSSFYAAYQAAFQAQQGKGRDATTADEARALADVLGTTHRELSAMRGVSTESQATYASVLNKAYSAGGLGNARQFLATLSALEMDAVRQNHCLAGPIDTASLSEEGAANLLLPEGYSVDLNRDGIDEVGAARTAHFPPRDAPDAFKEAWFQATAGMDEGSMMTYGLMMHDAVYGMQIDGQSQGSRYAVDSLDSYRQIISDYLASLEANKGFLADGQYARDKDFFTRLQALLAAAR
ncbi:hypothetical protein [Zoogloea sp.]|uniref:hypothetical protein n=1 Tax=Zoogloea sp. TaxID=49181 RepID=UPI0014160982|nr:MAG: hypothetical protein F9K15_09255 [Zoogloea sp.]